jgi:CBS domain containing-hemolysin-like protein
MEIESEVFDDARQDADTLGGMLLELQEEMPKQGDEIVYADFKFVIESADKRRIKRVKVEILNPQNHA